MHELHTSAIVMDKKKTKACASLRYACTKRQLPMTKGNLEMERDTQEEDSTLECRLKSLLTLALAESVAFLG